MKKEKKKLPKQYNVGGQTINITEVPSIDGGKLGICSVPECLIKIANTWDGHPQSHDSKENTMWHEIVHSILDTMGEFDLSHDEKFVCTFSSFLTEVIKSMK